jgi:hypothetical protein
MTNNHYLYLYWKYWNIDFNSSHTIVSSDHQRDLEKKIFFFFWARILFIVIVPFLLPFLWYDTAKSNYSSLWWSLNWLMIMIISLSSFEKRCFISMCCCLVLLFVLPLLHLLLLLFDLWRQFDQIVKWWFQCWISISKHFEKVTHRDVVLFSLLALFVFARSSLTPMCYLLSSS